MSSQHFCKPCDKYFAFRSGLTRHFKSLTHLQNIGSEELIEEFKCECCELSFTRQDGLDRHHRSDKHIITEIEQSVGKIKEIIDYSDFEEIESDSSKCKCIICNNKMINDTYTKKRHLKSKTHISNKTKISNIELSDDIQYKYHCWEHNYHTNRLENINIHMDGKLHTMTKEEYKEYKEYRSNLGYKSHKIGDELEEYMTKIYKKCDDIEDVKRIGQTSNTYDIKIKYKNEDFYRGIQVKSISKNKRNDYAMGIRGNYKDNTLLIGSNIERTFFVIIPYLIVKKLSTNVGFTYKKETDYYEYCYIDINKFEQDLFKLSKLSTIMGDEDDTLSKNHKVEAKSLRRLENKCKELNLKFEERKTNTTVVDCVINGKNIQCKASNTKRGNLWNYHLDKTYKGERVPYDENDNVDFFIFETEENNFYIIPKQELISQGNISTKTNIGRKGISLPQKDYKEYRTSLTHWALKYLNAFNLIDNKIESNEKELQCLDKVLKELKLEYKQPIEKLIQ